MADSTAFCQSPPGTAQSASPSPCHPERSEGSPSLVPTLRAGTHLVRHSASATRSVANAAFPRRTVGTRTLLADVSRSSLLEVPFDARPDIVQEGVLVMDLAPHLLEVLILNHLGSG